MHSLSADWVPEPAVFRSKSAAGSFFFLCYRFKFDPSVIQFHSPLATLSRDTRHAPRATPLTPPELPRYVRFPPRRQ